jgi:hypothetical protein
MNRLPKAELLQSLHAQLKHFDHSPDFGDADAVAVIRKHLLLRIREAEGALRDGVGVQSDRRVQPAFHSEAA